MRRFVLPAPLPSFPPGPRWPGWFGANRTALGRSPGAVPCSRRSSQMTALLSPAPGARSLHQVHAAFLADVLPRVEAHGRVYFRHVRCPERKEELLSELRGLVWKWYVRLVRRGKNVL